MYSTVLWTAGRRAQRKRRPREARGPREFAGMGGTLSYLPQVEVETYKACTCLNAAEIDDVFEKFTELGGTRVGKGQEEQHIGTLIGYKTAKNLRAPQSKVSISSQTSSISTVSPDQLEMELGDNGQKKVSAESVCGLPEFANNPLAPRLCRVFSANGSGNLDFDEFLDLFHVLSPKAETSVKILTAFRVYDFDDDNYLGTEDLKNLIRTTTTKQSKTCVDAAQPVHRHPARAHPLWRLPAL